MAFDPGDRTYYLSDARLHAFRALPAEDKLRWVEELAAFLRMTRSAEKNEHWPAQSAASIAVDSGT
ncbi:MAG: hypothetical protein ACLGGY_05750 [Gammaproteobacteria bacterium]